jgi:hypothetical protein
MVLFTGMYVKFYRGNNGYAKMALPSLSRGSMGILEQ